MRGAAHEWHTLSAGTARPIWRLEPTCCSAFGYGRQDPMSASTNGWTSLPFNTPS